MKLDNKKTNPKLREALPRLDEVHFGLNQVQILKTANSRRQHHTIFQSLLHTDDHTFYLHISMGFKDLLTEFRLAFVTEPRGNVVLNLS